MEGGGKKGEAARAARRGGRLAFSEGASRICTLTVDLETMRKELRRYLKLCLCQLRDCGSVRSACPLLPPTTSDGALPSLVRRCSGTQRWSMKQTDKNIEISATRVRRREGAFAPVLDALSPPITFPRPPRNVSARPERQPNTLKDSPKSSPSAVNSIRSPSLKESSSLAPAV